MGRKAVFFDIDGTIWDFQQRIPDSTVRAIRALRRNGNLAFLCSGRSRAFIIGDNLFDIGFDGIVAGCGTYVEKGQQVLLNDKVPAEVLADTVREMKKREMPLVLEGTRNLFVDREEFRGDPFLNKLVALMGDDILPILGNRDKWTKDTNKMSVNLVDKDIEEWLGWLAEQYEIIKHGDSFMELVPKGHTKASGIRFVCSEMGILPEDTVAFGDSSNDISMLEYAGVGVVMGNGTDEAKEAGDFVTKDIHDDGIEYALKKLELI
jgi:Cof subfamily protein (haloacid dehalogenase superfamily)